MKNRCLVRVVGVFLLSASFLLTGGCGFKNKPVPPESVVPQAIDDLRYTVSDKGVKLTWSFPVKTIKGSILDDISSFQLFRAEISLEEYCGSCPVPFAEPVTVAGGSPLDGETRRKVVFDSNLLRPGYKYFFKVRSRTSWFADSADSNIITLVWFDPAVASGKVTVTPGDRQISLVWQPVALKTAGKDLAIKYQVLRSLDGKDYTKIGDPQAATSYIDRQVSNGQKYFYSVQSLTEYKNELAEGGVSKEVVTTPIDLTPPISPTGVTAVRTDAGIKVFWDRSDAPDLAGYRVYRRAADKDIYEMLGQVEPTFTLFVDTKAVESVRYYYAITALDGATPANESSKSKEATIRN
ncbi:MAG: hypothetical protein KJ630_06645 [Proteobacteria bacterium]|nr:hypothetical protein [Pseudomonadota bacterium]